MSNNDPDAQLEYKERKHNRIVRVCKYIQENEGKMLSYGQLGRAATGSETVSASFSFVKSLVDRNIIGQQKFDPSREDRFASFSYFVKDKSWLDKEVIESPLVEKVDEPEKSSGEITAAQDVDDSIKDLTSSKIEVAPEVRLTRLDYGVVSIDEIKRIESLAREFSWTNNSDSVREFIKSLK